MSIHSVTSTNPLRGGQSNAVAAGEALKEKSNLKLNPRNSFQKWPLWPCKGARDLDNKRFEEML